MRIGICCGTGQLADAKAAGYAYAEMAVTGVLIPEASEAEFAPNREKVLASPIPVEAFNCFVPGHIKVTGPEVNLDHVEAYMEVALRRTHECGASIVVFGSGGARAMPEGFPKPKARVQYLDAVRIAGDIGEKYGVTIVLEPLLARADNLFNYVSEGMAFVDALEHPRVKLLTDLTGFLGALKQAGYDGRVSVEDNPGLLGKTGENYAAAIAAVRAYVESQMPVTV